MHEWARSVQLRCHTVALIICSKIGVTRSHDTLVIFHRAFKYESPFNSAMDMFE